MLKRSDYRTTFFRAGIHCLALTTLLLSGSLLATTETYYKWKDESGNWSYGLIPPHGVEAIEIQTTGGAPKQADTGVPENETAASVEQGSSEPTTTEYLVEQRNQPSKAEQQRLCKAAKANLETLQSSAVIRLRNDDGSVKTLSDSERQQEIDTAKQTIKDFC